MSEPGSTKTRPVLPPPPAGRDDAPEPVTVPPLDPPPPSLEALVQSRARRRPGEQRPWLVVVALFVLGVLVTLYFRR